MKDNGSWDKIPQDPSEEQLPEASESTWQENTDTYSASDVQDGEQHTSEESEPAPDGWQQLDQQTNLERFRTTNKKKSSKKGKKKKSKASPNQKKNAKKRKNNRY